MSSDGQYQLFDRNLPLLNAPAYIRRGREVEYFWSLLLEKCRREREALIEMPRMRLGILFAVAGDSFELLTALWPDSTMIDYLRQLHGEWQPRLRTQHSAAQTVAELRSPADAMMRSFARFNRRWRKFVEEIDLRKINALREGYNRFYLVEKECALRSARIAREGFDPLPMVTIDGLLDRFPLLIVPEIAAD